MVKGQGSEVGYGIGAPPTRPPPGRTPPPPVRGGEGAGGPAKPAKPPPKKEEPKLKPKVSVPETKASSKVKGYSADVEAGLGGPPKVKPRLRAEVRASSKVKGYSADVEAGLGGPPKAIVRAPSKSAPLRSIVKPLETRRLINVPTTTLPDGWIIADSDLAAIKQDTSKLHKLIIKEGYEAYMRELKASYIVVPSGSKGFPRGVAVSRAELKELANRYPRAYDLLTTEGLYPYMKKVDALGVVEKFGLRLPELNEAIIPYVSRVTPGGKTGTEAVPSSLGKQPPFKFAVLPLKSSGSTRHRMKSSVRPGVMYRTPSSGGHLLSRRRLSRHSRRV